MLARLTDGADPNMVCHQALEDWRDLLLAARAGTTLEDAIGLIGELTVLECSPKRSSPADALSSWWGPARHVHDFYSDDNCAIEVKTTQMLDGNRVNISNLDQLDPLPAESLHLAVVRVRPNTVAPSLDDRIRTALALGFSSSANSSRRSPRPDTYSKGRRHRHAICRSGRAFLGRRRVLSWTSTVGVARPASLRA